MLLTDGKRHYFSVEFAAKYGLEAAILAEHFSFWIEKNQSDGRNFHDGRYWTFCSVSSLQNIFSYLSIGKIRGALNTLLKEGVIIKGNFNKLAYDRTSWYSFTDAFYNFTNPFVNKTNGFDSVTNDICDYNKPIPDYPPDYPPDSPPDDYTTHTLLENEKRPREKVVIPTQEETWFSDRMYESFTMWIEYKKEQHRYTYRSTGLKSLVTTIRNNVDQYGEELVCRLITECMSNGWKGIAWDRLKMMDPVKKKGYEYNPGSMEGSL